ncbi:hypothetical protein EG329_010935 [Mollisiaceae sp. DMI_Dod_QoI]|nr:hypothetical protein EG329_010935 [Helotiales sp. DMI_Dod_QoI]
MPERWIFACQHEYILSPCPVPRFSDGLITRKTSIEQCPLCKEELAEKQESMEQQALNDQQTLAIWRKQSKEIVAHIKDAKRQNNQDTVQDLETMLKNCNAMWMKKVEEIEKKEAAQKDTSRSAAAVVFEETLKRRMEHVRVLLQAEADLSDDSAALHSNSRLRNIKALSERLNLLRMSYESEVEAELIKMKRNLDDCGKQFLELISGTGTGAAVAKVELKLLVPGRIRR